MYKDINDKTEKNRLKKNDIKSRIEKGSYTVEATVVMGITFLVISAVLYVASFIYGRACLTASAYEQAYTGRIQEEFGLFGFSSVERTCTFEETENIVSYTGSCYSVWGGFQNELTIDAKVIKEKPVTFIRKCQAAGEIGR